jgi:hypothetical protein
LNNAIFQVGPCWERYLYTLTYSGETGVVDDDRCSMSKRDEKQRRKSADRKIHCIFNERRDEENSRVA